MFLIFLFATLPLAHWLHAEEAPADFESANKLYEEGKFAEATAAYDKLIESGKISAAVYFNRGNAFFRLGQLGRAIASYHKAERLAPRDRELRANLQIARTKARGGVAYSTPRWKTLLGVLSLNEWALLTAVGLWAVFIFLAVIQWRTDLRPTLQKYVFAAGMVAIVAGICLVIELNSDYFVARAVIIVGEAEVRNGPLDESVALYKVRDGAELEILDRKEGWLQVVDSAQRSGWVRQDQLLELADAKSSPAGK